MSVSILTPSTGYPPGLSPAIWDRLRPSPEVSSWEWLGKHGRAHNGQPLDVALIPWARGVCDAHDDPQYEILALQWGARTAKSTLCHNLVGFNADTQPGNAMLCTPTEALTKQHIEFRLYPLFERIPRLTDKLPPTKRRSQTELRYGEGVVRGAWSGSETKLSDFSARVLHGAEVSKFDKSASEEGDPLDQFMKRAAEYPDRKILLESTPQLRDRCRIEAVRKQGTDCRFNVPCPHCGAHQVLRRLTETQGLPENKGIVFARDSDGKLDADIAYYTAVYVCPHCEGEISDLQRPAMMRAGVWCPRGCVVDREGELRGTPVRPKARIWSSQLSAYYSLDMRWGDLAAEYVRKHLRNNPFKRRTFVQLTEGETFAHQAVLTEPEELAARRGTDVPRGTVPAWTKCLVFSSDVQKDTFPWEIHAFGEGGRKHLVDFGVATDWDELAELLNRPVGEFAPCMGILDSGHRTELVYKFCNKHHRPGRPVFACKGADSSLSGKPFRIVELGEGSSRARRGAAIKYRGQRLVHVNTDHWEEVLQAALDAPPGDDSGLSLCKEAAADLEFLADLLNGTPSDQVDSRGNAKLLWVKRDPEQPNDFRDTSRYGLCGLAVLLSLRHGRWPPKVPGTRSQEAGVSSQPAPARRPGIIRKFQGRRFSWRR